VAVFTADFPLNARVGLDLNLSLTHDQPGLELSKAAFILGAGPGATFYFGKWSVSPMVSLCSALGAGGWSLLPAVNVGYTL
jgi:hypothetical protein